MLATALRIWQVILGKPGVIITTLKLISTFSQKKC